MNFDSARVVTVRTKTQGTTSVIVAAAHTTRLALQKLGIDLDEVLRDGGTIAEAPARAVLQYADAIAIRPFVFGPEPAFSSAERSNARARAYRGRM